MMRVYTLTKEGLHSSDVASVGQLHELSSKVDWLYVDLNSDDKEVVSKLLGNEKVLDEIEQGRFKPDYENCHDYTLISIPLVEFERKLKIHPLYIVAWGNMFVTLGNKLSHGPIENTIRTLKDCVTNARGLNSSFVISRLFREVTDENLKAMEAIRDFIDELEEEALEAPWKKKITRSIFALKKEVSKFHRLLWVEKELLLDLKEGVIPRVKVAEEEKVMVDDSINDIDRELEFIHSYNITLDSILRLQDLGSIRRVERTLVYLTLMIIVINAVLIVLSILK